MALADRLDQQVSARYKPGISGKNKKLDDAALENMKTTFETMKALPPPEPTDVEGLRKLGRMSRSMMSASSAMRNPLLKDGTYEDFNTAKLVMDQMLETTNLLRERGIVHDEAAMMGLLNDHMGPSGSVASANIAMDRLPGCALALPEGAKGDEQAVRMMTRMAQLAVKDAGLEALKTDPSYGPYLEDNRFGTVLSMRGIDITTDTPANNKELREAVAALREKGKELPAE